LLLKFYLSPTDLLGLVITGVATGVFGLSLVLLLTNSSQPEVYWDKDRNLVTILRSWTVEVCSARILSSVPIGIDLSHSGEKVLQAMHTRFKNKTGGTLVFFIIRPKGNESTKIGFLVRRRGLRLWNGISSVDRLVKQLVADSMILESSMRSAYPHLPVEIASFEEVLKTTAGGIVIHAIT
ncbi:MAG: hypothetical protein IH631_03175, partial [Candidatus Thorarchaeota archaeon]|nr:hypothetical protein [Candidatus Thorarchaeota archaeon]